MEHATNQHSIYTVAEIQLVYRSKVKPSERPKVNTSSEAYKIFIESWDKDRIELVEQFKVMLLNRRNRVLGIYEMSTGGMSGTVADAKLIFVSAIKTGACEILLAHNHPSGILTPSRQDEQLTALLKEGGKYLDIRVSDHLIISAEGYYSFADEGLL